MSWLTKMSMNHYRLPVQIHHINLVIFDHFSNDHVKTTTEAQLVPENGMSEISYTWSATCSEAWAAQWKIRILFPDPHKQRCEVLPGNVAYTPLRRPLQSDLHITLRGNCKPTRSQFFAGLTVQEAQNRDMKGGSECMTRMRTAQPGGPPSAGATC